MAEAKKGRRRKSAATRQVIIDAAHEMFTNRGFHGATVEAIAKQAGVAPQTVYFTFNNKAKLISAVVDAAVMGPEETAPQDQAWWQEMLEEPDPTRSLQTFIRGAGPAFHRASPISEVVAAAARTDDEVMEIFQHHESLRREAFGQVLDMLANKGPLRPDLTRDRLLDVFLVVYGDATYHQLTTQMGWSHDDVMDWLCEHLPPMLLDSVDPDAESR
jgi:AcrR family transcriptional regulator